MQNPLDIFVAINKGLATKKSANKKMSPKGKSNSGSGFKFGINPEVDADINGNKANSDNAKNKLDLENEQKQKSSSKSGSKATGGESGDSSASAKGGKAYGGSATVHFHEAKDRINWRQMGTAVGIMFGSLLGLGILSCILKYLYTYCLSSSCYKFFSGANRIVGATVSNLENGQNNRRDRRRQSVGSVESEGSPHRPRRRRRRSPSPDERRGRRERSSSAEEDRRVGRRVRFHPETETVTFPPVVTQQQVWSQAPNIVYCDNLRSTPPAWFQPPQQMWQQLERPGWQQYQPQLQQQQQYWPQHPPQLPHLPTHPTAPFPQEMTQRIYPVLSNDMAKGAVTEYVTLPISSRTRQALADNGTLAQVRDVTERPHPSPRARNQQQQQQQVPPGPDGPQVAGGANGHSPEEENNDQDAGNGFDFGNRAQ